MERVKHLFQTENIVFLLVVNQEQLVGSIKGVYGSNDQEARLYLQKFVNINMRLQPPETFGAEVDNFVSDLLSRHCVPQSLSERDSIPKFYQTMYAKHRFTLRDIEKCITNLCMILAIAEKPHITMLAAGLSILKFKSPEIIDQILEGANMGMAQLRSTTCFESIFSKERYKTPQTERVKKAFEFVLTPSPQFKREDLPHEYMHLFSEFKEWWFKNSGVEPRSILLDYCKAMNLVDVNNG